MASTSPLTIAAALAVSIVTVTAGYVGLGALPAFLFTFGFAGGFVAWRMVKARPEFAAMRTPFYLTFALFPVHKIEERELGFFPALSELTGVAVPAIDAWVSLVMLASAGLWLFIPFLVKRRIEFGYYLAWTFFTAMGVTEAAHFIFPLFRDGGYRYFPGMMSVLALVPIAWWGMIRLARTVNDRDR